MKFWTNIRWRKLLRSLHRDLGYFFVGITCIYAISGYILNSKTEGKDPAFEEIVFEKQIKTDLSNTELYKGWEKIIPDAPTCKRIIPVKDKFLIYVNGGMGEYDPISGNISLLTYKEKPIVKFMNNIHYNQGKRFTWLANFFAITMIFFAISGIVIVKGKRGFKKRGVWLMIVGIIVPFLLYFL